MIGRLAGLALDARFALRPCPEFDDSPRSRAVVARWVAANALAAAGVTVSLAGPPVRAQTVFSLQAPSLMAMVAAVAAVPALVDQSTLPRTWRLALLALGLPVLDRPVAATLAGGASVLTLDGLGSRELAVETTPTGYRVRVGRLPLQLAS